MRNSNHGGWGNEEKAGLFPFEANHEFDLIILVESSNFRVTVDGSFLFDFWHRASFRDVRRISIEGDVECRHISFVGVGLFFRVKIYKLIRWKIFLFKAWRWEWS